MHAATQWTNTIHVVIRTQWTNTNHVASRSCQAYIYLYNALHMKYIIYRYLNNSKNVYMYNNYICSLYANKGNISSLASLVRLFSPPPVASLRTHPNQAVVEVVRYESPAGWQFSQQIMEMLHPKIPKTMHPNGSSCLFFLGWSNLTGIFLGTNHYLHSHKTWRHAETTPYSREDWSSFNHFQALSKTSQSETLWFVTVFQPWCSLFLLAELMPPSSSTVGIPIKAPSLRMAPQLPTGALSVSTMQDEGAADASSCGGKKTRQFSGAVKRCVFIGTSEGKWWKNIKRMKVAWSFKEKTTRMVGGSCLAVWEEEKNKLLKAV